MGFEHLCEQRVDMHALQLATACARRFMPGRGRECLAQCFDHGDKALAPFRVGGAGVVREAGGMRVEVHGAIVGTWRER